jgi:transcriptional regulator with XRE-family HTH domain
MARRARPVWVLARRREVGHRIAALRASRGMTVEQLAEAAGLERKVIVRAENATTSTGVDLLVMIARGLDVPTGDLFSG